MGYFRKKPVVIEAITFDEFVEYGKKFIAENPTQGNYGPDGRTPWHFKYHGHPISHENDQCYLIPTLEGTYQMTPNDVLITGVKGEIYPCKIEIFNQTYETVLIDGQIKS